MGNETNLVFLLHNGISLSTTLGSIKSAANSSLNETTSDSENDLRTAFANKDSGSGSGGGGFKFGMLSAKGAGSKSWDKETSSERNEMVKQYNNDLKSIAQQFTGDLSAITAMNLESAKKLTNNKTFSSSLNYASEAKFISKPYNYIFGFQKQSISPEAVQKLAEDWYLIWLRYNQNQSFSNIDLSTASEAFKQTIQDPSHKDALLRRCKILASFQPPSSIVLYDSKTLGTNKAYAFKLTFGIPLPDWLPPIVTYYGLYTPSYEITTELLINQNNLVEAVDYEVRATKSSQYGATYYNQGDVLPNGAL
jgi:hypothetical protein